MQSHLVFMEVSTSRHLSATSRTVSAPPEPTSHRRSLGLLKRQAAVEDRSFAVVSAYTATSGVVANSVSAASASFTASETFTSAPGSVANSIVMERAKSCVTESQPVSSGYFRRSPSQQRRRESEEMARKTSVDNSNTAGTRRTSVVEPPLGGGGAGARRKSSADTSVSMYFKRSPTQLRRDSGKTDDVTGRKGSVDVAPVMTSSTSRRMSIEPSGASDRRKASTETSVSGYFKRSPIQGRRESDDLVTRKSSMDNSRKTSVDTACTVIYRPPTISETTNVAVSRDNGEIREHEGEGEDSPRRGGFSRESRSRESRSEKERDRDWDSVPGVTGTGGGGAPGGGGSYEGAGNSAERGGGAGGGGTSLRDGKEDRETDTELDRRFQMERDQHNNNSNRSTRRSHEFGDRLTVRDARRKVSGTSRSSMSSLDSDTHNNMAAMSKRWTTLETVGRCMFLFSVAFFIVGVLITVFGFSNTGIDRSQQLPLQVLGPTCLAMTVVMWVIGCVFSRLWNLEWKRQQHAFELRDRVQLHALAMDILNNPVISPGMLQDPSLRRQLLMKLRSQRTLDLSSEYSESRRSSRAPSETSKRRYSSVQYEKLFQQDPDGRKRSRGSMAEGKPPFELPGIQISRIETLDFGSDGRASICSGSTRSRGSRQYIIIHSDVASDFSRLSCPSDYSLAGSRSSRSRGSRASSNLSSRMWDFSPRESDWDADISLGSRESQLSVLRQDWGGGPMDSTDCLSPHMPRRLSVVTFDTGSPTLRRHSSPVCPTRRKDSLVHSAECTCGRGEPYYPGSIMRNRDNSCHSLRFSDGIRIVESTAARKRSADLISCRSLRIDEDEHGELLHEASSSRDKERQVQTTSTSTQAEASVSTASSTTDPPATGAGGPGVGGAGSAKYQRPPLRRNNTDDSEVERRVARLFKEIEYSVSESVDDSKIHSFSSDFDYFGNKQQQKVEAKEAQTQTMTESDMDGDLEGLVVELPGVGGGFSGHGGLEAPGGTSSATKTQSWNESLGSHESHSSESHVTLEASEAGSGGTGSRRKSTSGGSGNGSGGTVTGSTNTRTGSRKKSSGKKKKSRSFEKTLSTISNALHSFGRRTISSDKEKEKERDKRDHRHPAQRRPIPTLIVMQGLSIDQDEEEADIEAQAPTSSGHAQIHEYSPSTTSPPTYEDVVNKNL